MSTSSRHRWIGFVGALALLIWGGVEFYRSEIRYNLWPRNFGVVDEGKIYRGGEQTPGMLKELVAKYKIKTVVDLGAYEPGSADEKQAKLTIKSLGLERFEFRLKGDGTGDPNCYVKALNVMTDPTKQPVLVHCSTGAQRTSGCVVFYRHASQNKSLDEAYQEAQNFKHNPDRNPKLRPYIDEWADKIAKSFRSGQAIVWKEKSGS